MMNLSNMKVHRDIFLNFTLFAVLSNYEKTINDVSVIKNEIATLTECDYIALGREYDMDDILENIDMFDQAQCFDEYFHRR